ncbi:Membrane sensor protein UhpC [Mycolicibacterium mageritense]|uniref:Membrane sensor protein UhpC n=2 Tax=Mycobacteriaceae TaxID=1762 RepID=A0AAI8TU24_MYCME|nr:MFS transporter [Mycobacterium sp. DSM 3803]BDY28965.1 Membrane sensor protein UhpC [Mycolicibacterium mageritense]
MALSPDLQHSSIKPLDQLRRWRIQIFAVTWLVYFALYFTRQAFSTAKVGILDDPSMSAMTEPLMGVLDATYLTAYAVGQFVWGTLADRFGPRRVLLVGLAVSAASAALMGFTTAIIGFGLLMVAQGLAQSSGWAPLCKNMSAFFAVSERGRVFGWWTTNYALGGLVAGPFAGWWAYSVFHNWRAAFISTAAVVALVLVITAVAQRDTPKAVGLGDVDIDDWASRRKGQQKSQGVADSVQVVEGPDESVVGGANQAEVGILRGIRDSFLVAVRDRMVLRLGLAYFLLKPSRYAILLWGPIIVLKRAPQVTDLEAVIVPVTFGVGGVLGPILIGWASDRLFQSRRIPATVISVVILAVASAAFVPLTSTGDIAMIAVILGLIGLSMYAADSVLSATAAVDFGTKEHAGAAVGFVNGSGSVGAILGGLIPGFVGPEALFYSFAALALLTGVLLLPSWRLRAATA